MPPIDKMRSTISAVNMKFSAKSSRGDKGWAGGAQVRARRHVTRLSNAGALQRLVFPRCCWHTCICLELPVSMGYVPTQAFRPCSLGTVQALLAACCLPVAPPLTCLLKTLVPGAVGPLERLEQGQRHAVGEYKQNDAQLKVWMRLYCQRGAADRAGACGRACCRHRGVCALWGHIVILGRLHGLGCHRHLQEAGLCVGAP